MGETNACNPRLVQLLKFGNEEVWVPYRKRRSSLDKTCFTGIATNRSPAEQFYTFFNLAAWLITEYGQVKINPLKEGEDSITSIRGLLQLLRQLNFAVPSNLSTSQLQGGSGREICGILNGLVDWALQRASHQFQPPQHPVEEDDGCAVVVIIAVNDVELYIRQDSCHHHQHHYHASTSCPVLQQHGIDGSS